MLLFEENILMRLKQCFPQFEFDEEGVILNLSKLAINFQKGHINDAEQFFGFINEIADTDNEDQLSILGIGILEILTDTKELQDLSLQCLKGNSLRLYNQLFDYKFRRL